MAAGSFADSHRLEFPTGDIGERADGCGHDGREIKSAAATVGSIPVQTGWRTNLLSCGSRPVLVSVCLAVVSTALQ